MNNHNYTYLAKGVYKVSEPHLEAFEDIEVFLKTKEEVLELIERIYKARLYVSNALEVYGY